jgi:serine/threonine protein kinase
MGTSELRSYMIASAASMGTLGGMLPPELQERYVARTILGRGGFGRVVAARDRELGREVAVKVLEVTQQDDDLRRRFVREARLTASLQHPHIVGVYDHGLGADGAAWILYELIEGEDLMAWAARARPSPETLARIGAEISEALVVVHAAGILHRDLKPGNILVRPDGAAVLCDFGIARSLNTQSVKTMAGVIMGTPAYMAPELFLGVPASPVSDVFALAASLFEVCHGRGPYDADGLRDILRAVNSDSSLPRAFTPRDAFDRVLVDGLQRDSTRRTQDAEGFAASLRDAITEIAPPSLPDREMLATVPDHSQEPEETREDDSDTLVSASAPAPRGTSEPSPLLSPRLRRRVATVVLLLVILLGACRALNVPLDPSALSLLWAARVDDQASAQATLATRYRDGAGFPRDGAAARHWALRALEHPSPDPRARRLLSELALGEVPGAPRDLAASVRWAREAIESHDTRTASGNRIEDWRTLERAMNAARLDEEPAGKLLLEDWWKEVATSKSPDPRRLGFVARAMLVGSGNILDRVRGRVALWRYHEGSPVSDLPDLDLERKYGWSATRARLLGSRPWAWYGPPAAGRDPLAQVMLGRSLVAEPERTLPMDPVWVRETGLALLSKVMGECHGLTPICQLAQADPGHSEVHPNGYRAGDPSWLGPLEKLRIPGEPEPVEFDLGPEPPPPPGYQHHSKLIAFYLSRDIAEKNGELLEADTQRNLGLQMLGPLRSWALGARSTRRAADKVARYWLRRSALGGDARALYELSRYKIGSTTREAALAWRREAARRGWGPAMLEWAEDLGDDDPHGGDLTRSAAGRAEGAGWVQLAYLLTEGRQGVPRDPLLAAVAIEHAARMGRRTQAATMLAGLYAKGLGFREDLAQAERLRDWGRALQ